MLEIVIGCDVLYRECQQKRQALTDVMWPVSHPIIQYTAPHRARLQIATSNPCTFTDCCVKTKHMAPTLFETK